MIRIWAKVIKDNRIEKQYMFESLDKMDYSRFFEFLTDICSHLDIATPVLIKTHLFNYAKYNTVKFTRDDFLEQISFDKLVLENAFL